VNLALKEGEETYVYDVKTAYLLAGLEEEVYMEIPPGADIPEEASRNTHVWRLKKAIPGTKQAGRMWYKQVVEDMASLGYTPCITEPCVFQKDGSRIGVYVDDLVCTTSQKVPKKMLDKAIRSKWPVRGGEPLAWYLGVAYHKNGNTIYAEQTTYIEKMIEKYNVKGTRDTPGAAGVDFGDYLQSKYESARDVPYRNLVGELLFLARMTRMDILWWVTKLGQYVEDPRLPHWKALIDILSYLNGTKDLCIRYDGAQKPILEMYVDSDWGGDTQGRKSTSGYIIFLGGTPIHWASKKQTGTAASSAQAEYVALGTATNKLLGIMNFLEELGYKQSVPVKVWEDNETCIAMTQTFGPSGKTKHIELKYHITKDAVANGKINVCDIRTSDQLADILTKAPPTATLLRLRERLLFKKPDTNG
jgi:hypothetical protein